MQEPIESKLAPATQSLLDFLKAAKLKDSEGRPTVAGDAAAQAGVTPPETPPETPMEPSMAPPAETPPEQQGIASVLDQAQQAAPSVAMNMEQPPGAPPEAMPPQGMAPEGMPPQGMPQGMAPQGMAEGGLASIPVNIPQFKEGGVIGYDGTRGSYVNPGRPIGMLSDVNPEEGQEATSEFGQLLSRLLSPESPENQQREVFRRYLAAEREAEPGFFESLTGAERLQRRELQQKLKQLIQAKRMGVSGESDRAMAAQAIGSAMVAPRGIAQEVAPPARVPPEVAAAAARAASARAPSAAPRSAPATGIEVPRVEPLDLSDINTEIANLKAAQKNRPDLQSMGLADLAAQQQRDKESESFRRYAAIFGSRTPGINAGSSMLAAAGKFQALEDRAKSEADAAKTALAKAAYADSTGDIKEVLKYRNEAQVHMDNYRRDKAQVDTTVYEQQMMSGRAEEANALRGQLAEARIAAGLAGKTSNLRDPAFVADKISDNVTKQMEALVKQPNISMKLKTPEDFERVRDSLMRKEIAAFKRGGADTSFIESSLGQPLGGAAAPRRKLSDL